MATLLPTNDLGNERESFYMISPNYNCSNSFVSNNDYGIQMSCTQNEIMNGKLLKIIDKKKERERKRERGRNYIYHIS